MKNFFNRKIIIKIIIILSIGFFSRVFISNYFNVNVVIQYLHPISLIFYFFMATFIVYFNELFNLLNLNLFFSFFYNIFSMFYNSFIYLYTYFKLDYLSLSFIRNLFKEYLNSSKSKFFLFYGQQEDFSKPFSSKIEEKKKL